MSNGVGASNRVRASKGLGLVIRVRVRARVRASSLVTGFGLVVRWGQGDLP